MKKLLYIFTLVLSMLTIGLGIPQAHATDTQVIATYLFGTRYVPEEVSVSPDGQWAAITIRGNGIPNQDPDTTGIWVIRSDGSQLTRVLSTNDVSSFTLDHLSWGDASTLYARVGYWSIWKLTNFLPGLVSVQPDIAPAMSTIRVTPTPANGNVNIAFTLTSEQQLEVNVYDVLGRKVDTVKESSRFGAGLTTLVWKPKSGTSGVFFIRAQGESFQKTSRAVVLR